MPNATPIVYEFDYNMKYIRNYTLTSSVDGHMADQEYQSLTFRDEASSPSSDENEVPVMSEFEPRSINSHIEDRINLQQVLIN